MDRDLATILRHHRERTKAIDSEWIFANPETGNPYWPSKIRENHLVPAGEAAGISRSCLIPPFQLRGRASFPEYVRANTVFLYPGSQISSLLCSLARQTSSGDDVTFPPENGLAAR
jgi:hypothetical protein